MIILILKLDFVCIMYIVLGQILVHMYLNCVRRVLHELVENRIKFLKLFNEISC